MDVTLVLINRKAQRVEGMLVGQDQARAYVTSLALLVGFSEDVVRWSSVICSSPARLQNSGPCAGYTFHPPGTAPGQLQSRLTGTKE